MTSQFGPESFRQGSFKPLDLLKRVLDRGGERACRGPHELSAFVSSIEELSAPKPAAAKVAIIGAGPAAVVERGYDETLAVTEGCRCLDCGVNTIFDSNKCILCGGCADVCPELCLQLVSLDRLMGAEELASLIETRYAGEEAREMSAIVKDEAKCVRCALCAERCPVGAITMERFGFSGRWEKQPA